MSFGRRILTHPLSRLLLWILGVALMQGAYLAVGGFVPTGPWSGLLGEMPLALFGIAAMLLIVRFVERRTAAEAGLGMRGIGTQTATGFGIGAVLLSVVIGLMALAGFYHLKYIASGEAGIWSRLGYQLWIYLWVGVFEEVAFRGIFFRLMDDWLGSWAALALSAVVFGALHLMNVGATLVAAIGIALEAGVLLAGAYMLTRSLWLPIGIHWAWNFFEGPVYGTAVSGGADPTGVIHRGLFRPEMHGPALWTGGAFGPEAGLITMLVCTVAGVLMVLLAVRRGHVMPAAWKRRAAQAEAGT